MRRAPLAVFVVLNAPYLAVIAVVFNGSPLYRGLSSVEQFVLASWIPVIALALYAAIHVEFTAMYANSIPETVEESQ